MSGDDLYAVLGVSAEASTAQIVQAYRRRAHAAHPDTHPGDPTATARFRALTDAYDELRDPVRRAAYDRDRVASRSRARSPSSFAADAPVDQVPPVPSTQPPRPPGFAVRQPLWAGPVRVDPPATTRTVTTRPDGVSGWRARMLATWLDELDELGWR